MSSAEQIAGARVGAAFRLLMQARILIACVSLLLVPWDDRAVGGFLIVIGVALLSSLALFAWGQIVPWLLRQPVLIGFDVFVSYAVLEAGDVLGPFFLFTVLTAAVAGLLYRWQGMLLVCGLQILLYYAAAAGGRSTLAFQTLIAIPAFYPIAGFIGMGLRRLFDEQARLEEARRRAEVAVAAADERARLAREMHDSLAKTLRGIAMSAVALPSWMSRAPDRAEQEARNIAAAAEIAAREARQLIEELRDEVIEYPLAEACREVVASWGRDSGIAASVTADPHAELPMRVRYEVIAILKEALENVVRHAAAGSVEVRLAAEQDQVVLVVRDDGRGFAFDGELGDFLRGGHYGLVGMRERATTIGASLAVLSEPGAGTTVTVTVPSVRSESSPRLEAA
ncbi:sensor histidine kinase [Actinomadura macrotermitis]|uniref:Histidine kinase domain-containing protein n=1 Tax=Actinomadura macrotermitis TaxID=2585200 RepID=A0A7K0BT43_9ACTN|nr:ATP-binding protein [Actinomadura macrotermitis]MQY03854.1 hypothetical protein [Actinomadura macrotermitis]